MSLAPKLAQHMSLDGMSFPIESEVEEDQNDLRLDLEASPEDSDEELFLSDGGELSGEIDIEVEDEKPLHQEFDFTLPPIPGALSQEEEPEEEEVEEEEDELQLSDDPWAWTLETFMAWLHKKMHSVPSHTGKDTAGLERAISFFQTLDKEISKAVRQDKDGILDMAVIETARDEIHKGKERLEERLEQRRSHKYSGKKKKKADDQITGLVKEAGTASFTVTVPILISHIARTLINGMVSGGHDIEVSFQKMCKAYDLTKREQAEVKQVLSDMGLYVGRWDRGVTDGELDPTSSDNVDLGANYPA